MIAHVRSYASTWASGSESRRSIIRRLPSVYLVVVAISLVPYVLLQAPFKTPDAADQFAKALAITSGHLVGAQLAHGHSGLWVPRSIAQLFQAFNNVGPVYLRNFTLAEHLHWSRSQVFLSSSHSIITPFTSSAYAPYGYLPQAAAILISRLLNTSLLACYYLMCALNGVCAIVLSYTALRMARTGRPLLFGILCLPTTLSLYFSVSQDALVIALGALVFGLASRFATTSFSSYRAYIRAVIAVDVVATVLISTRFVYIPLLILPLVITPPAETTGRPFAGDTQGLFPRLWSGVRGRRTAILLGITCIPISLAWTILGFAVHYYGTAYPGASVYRQLRYEMAHPGPALGALLNAITGQVRVWWESLLGILGWLTLRLPKWVYAELTATLVLLALVGAFVTSTRQQDPGAAAAGSAPRENSQALLPVSWMIWSAVAIVLSCLLIVESQYLIWTPVGLGTVLGVTGRYFLPILPLAAFLIPQFAVALRRGVTNAALSLAILGLLVAEGTVAVGFIFAYWIR